MIWCVSNAISIVSLLQFIAVWPVNITFHTPACCYILICLKFLYHSLPSEFPIFSSYYLPSSKSFTFLPVYLHLAICYYHNQQLTFCQCLTMQLFSHFCIFMMPRPKGLDSHVFAYRYVNDLRSWGGVRSAPTVYLYRQISWIISIALPSSICYDTPTDNSYARHCRHISHIFYFLIFILHVTRTCSAHFSVHSDDILTNRSQKHLQNQAFCCQ